MKVIIAGSRDIHNPWELMDLIEESRWVINEVVSGGANGVDAMGERYAASRGIPIKKFPALWQRHGRTAGPIRNAEMAEYADALICLHSGSRGSLDMIAKAEAAGLMIHQRKIRKETV